MEGRGGGDVLAASAGVLQSLRPAVGVLAEAGYELMGLGSGSRTQSPLEPRGRLGT